MANLLFRWPHRRCQLAHGVIYYLSELRHLDDQVARQLGPSAQHTDVIATLFGGACLARLGGWHVGSTVAAVRVGLGLRLLLPAQG